MENIRGQSWKWYLKSWRKIQLLQMREKVLVSYLKFNKMNNMSRRKRYDGGKYLGLSNSFSSFLKTSKILWGKWARKNQMKLGYQILPSFQKDEIAITIELLMEFFLSVILICGRGPKECGWRICFFLQNCCIF